MKLKLGRNSKYPESLNPEIKRLYNEGASMSEIGRQLEVHPYVVKRRLEKMGIPIRDRSAAMKKWHERKSE